MAAEKSSFTLSIVLMVAMAVLLPSAAPAEGSYMTAWEGPGCNNFAERYSACGCTGINLHGGYEFVYQGQTGATYNQPDCLGVASARFRSSVHECNPIGWQSLFIQC